MFGQEMTIEQMESALEHQAWLEENVVGWGESADYVFWAWGGEENFYQKNVWDKVFGEKDEK